MGGSQYSSPPANTGGYQSQPGGGSSTYQRGSRGGYQREGGYQRGGGYQRDREGGEYQRGGASGYSRGGGSTTHHHSSGGLHQSSSNSSSGGQPRESREQNANYKSSLCKNFMQGNCKYGATCSFAHGDHDLRSGGGAPSGGSSHHHASERYGSTHMPPAPRAPPTQPPSVGGAYIPVSAPQGHQQVSSQFSPMNNSAFPPLGGGQPDAR